VGFGKDVGELNGSDLDRKDWVLVDGREKLRRKKVLKRGVLLSFRTALIR